MRSGHTKRHQGPTCTEGQAGEEARDQPHCKPKTEVSEETNPASTLILDFQLLELQGEKQKCVKATQSEVFCAVANEHIRHLFELRAPQLESVGKLLE